MARAGGGDRSGDPSEPRYRRDGGYLSRWCDGRVLLLGPSGVHEELQGLAAVVWTVLSEECSLSEVDETLAAWLEPDRDDGGSVVARAELMGALTVLISGGQVIGPGAR